MLVESGELSGDPLDIGLVPVGMAIQLVATSPPRSGAREQFKSEESEETSAS